jgi:hypothetical protein
MSTYDLLGFPAQISILLMTLALVLALVPYLGGKAVGPLNIPTLDAPTTRRLRQWGWLAPVAAALCYLPAWPQRIDANAPLTAFDVDVTFQSSAAPQLDCRQFPSASAVLKIAEQSYRTSIRPDCTATFAALPAAHRNRDATLGVDGAPGFVLRETGALMLAPGRPLTAILDDARLLPRLRIALLPSRVDAASPQLQQFQEALADKILNVSQMFAARGEEYAYLSQLKVWDEGPLTPSVQEMTDYWTSSHALELVRGQVDLASQPLTVHSAIFLGDLAPAPPRTVRLDLTITPADFARTHDSYSVVTLYALARDAQRLKRPTHVVASLLSEAHAIAQQIDDPAGSMADVRMAIDSMWTSLRGTGPTP